MKPLLFFGSLLLAIVAGAIGGILAVRWTPALPEPAPLTHVASVSVGAEAGSARLTGGLEALRSEVARLRAGATRAHAGG